MPAYRTQKGPLNFLSAPRFAKGFSFKVRVPGVCAHEWLRGDFFDHWLRGLTPSHQRSHQVDPHTRDLA